MIDVGATVGSYTIVARLGEGAFAEVFLAEHRETGQRYAIKVLRVACASDPILLARFRNEAKCGEVLQACSHVVRVHGLVNVAPQRRGGARKVTGESIAERPALVMDYIEGTDLQQLLDGAEARGAGLGVARALRYSHDVAFALQFAHRLGVCHRDVKPSNCLVDRASQRVFLADFGIALREGTKRVTKIAIGTRPYMAPEVLRHGPGASGPASDVYATGVMLFEMLTGKLPFDGDDEFEMMQRILNDPTPLPSQRGGGALPDGVDPLVAACLARDPAQRLADGAALFEALSSLRTAIAQAGGDAGYEVATPSPATPPRQQAAAPALSTCALIDVSDPLHPIAYAIPSTGLTLGYDAANVVVLDHPRVSSRHASVRHRAGGGGIALTDTSTNGTWVGGRCVRRATIDLGDGDLISLGRPPSAPRFLLVLIALLLALAPPPARADGKTYCVGGFEINGTVATRRSCQYAGGHSRWHFHCYVRGPDDKCRECWDEMDDTCDTVFLDVDQKGVYFKVSGAGAFGGGLGVGYECRRIGASPPESALIRKENGVVVPPPVVPPQKVQPPPPTPIDVRTITTVTPGPYAPGDRVKVQIRTESEGGRKRPVPGGEVTVIGPDGKETRIKVVPRSDGTATADVVLPAGGKVQIRYDGDPRLVPAGPGERIRSVQPSTVHLDVSQCRLRGVVESPPAGEVVVAGAPIALRGKIQDPSGAVVGAGALSPGTRAVFVVEMGSGRTERVAASFDGRGEAVASVTLPSPGSDGETVTVRLLGEGGARDFCPGPAQSVQLTSLGVSIDIVTPQPTTTCYTGRDCPLAITFKVPATGPARAVADRFIGSADLTVITQLRGDPGPTLKLQPNGTFSASWTPADAGSAELIVIARSGGREVRERREFNVREGLQLALPAELDLGEVAAGSGWLTTCHPLDFSASKGVEEQEIAFSTDAPSLILNAGGKFELPSAFKLGIDRLATLCLDDVPRCAGAEPPSVTLTVRPTDPTFSDQVRTVKVKWRVVGRSFLSCHWWWMAMVAGALLSLFIAVGVIRPYRFNVDDSVKLATKREALARAVARRLRDLPGGRAGFYRSAATGLREDGSATDKPGTATVVLAAHRGDVLIRSRGRVQRVNPQTKKLEDIPMEKDGFPASKNTVYCAGALYFQVG